MSYLIAISLGPVQDFIAAARRSRDLWYGSYLLSEIAKAAALALHKAGATLLFPSTENESDLVPGSDFTVANKLLALSDKSPQELCSGAKAAAQKQLEEAQGRALIETSRRKVQTDTSLMAAQTASFLEFSAVWVPYQPDHKSARSKVELLLAARKTVRDFEQYNLGSARPKSSLDGFRETVLHPNQRPRKLFESNLKSNEQLDAIGVVKRFAGPFGTRRMPEFDSTTDVAAQPYVRKIESSREFKEYQDFVQKHLSYGNNSYRNNALLYERDSRQLFDQGRKDLDPEDRAALQQLTEIRNKIYAIYGRPNAPYYALMIGDGDFMGQAIGNLQDARENQAFSRDLSRFASQAKSLVDKHEGCPVYTGGDDVMALLPLHTALGCVEELRRKFGEALANYGGVSFSVGLAVAHAMEPLSEVLRLAHSAESSAKRLPGKDAVCFVVCPRSGANVEIKDKWKVVALLREIAAAYEAKKLSLGFAHELTELTGRTPSELDDILKDLALTVAGKKRENAKAVSLIQEHVSDRASLSRLSQAMLVARPFYRAIQESRR